MFNKIASIKDIQIFIGLNNNIFYLKPETILNSINDNKVIKLEKPCSSLVQHGDNLLLLDDNNRIIESFPDVIIFGEQIYKTEANLIYFYKNKKPNRIYGIYANGEIIFESNETSGDFSLFDDFIIENRSTSLNKLDIMNHLLWRFESSVLGSSPYDQTIDKILGISNGNIWFNTEGGRLIALDIGTGRIAKKYSGDFHDSELGYTIIEKTGWVFFDDQDQSIKCISSFHFQSINTYNYLVEELYNYSEIDPQGIGKYKNVYSPLLQGNYFTFLAEKKHDYGGIRHAGIFDYVKKQMIWEHELITQEECNQTRNHLVRSQPLYMSGDKLYIKDFKNTLHIFELDK